MQTGPACSLPSFTAGALPPAALHSSPSPHQASPQGKLCPCCPGPAWAPGLCGQRCGSPSRCLVATNVVRFCLGALWCGCSSPGDVLCMANELLVAPGVPAPLPSPRFLSSLKAFLGNRRLEITLLSDVLLKEPFAAWWRGSVLAERACTQRCFSGDLGLRRPRATGAAPVPRQIATLGRGAEPGGSFTLRGQRVNAVGSGRARPVPCPHGPAGRWEGAVLAAAAP